MSLPPTFAEARALCDRVLAGEATHDEVLAMLDADYFAACDVTDLDPRHVDTIVRWALREHVRRCLRRISRNDSRLFGFDSPENCIWSVRRFLRTFRACGHDVNRLSHIEASRLRSVDDDVTRREYPR